MLSLRGNLDHNKTHLYLLPFIYFIGMVIEYWILLHIYFSFLLSIILTSVKFCICAQAGLKKTLLSVKILEEKEKRVEADEN